MKEKYCVFLLCLLLLTAGHAWALTVDKILATVNNEIISHADYRLFLKKIDPSAEKEDVDEKILRKLIEERILLYEAKKAGLEGTDAEVEQNIKDFLSHNNLSKEEFDKTLAEEEMTLVSYKKIIRDNIILFKFVDREVDAKIVVTDQDIQQYYEQNRKKFVQTPETTVVKAIFLKIGENSSLTEITDLKLKALKIFAEIGKGESFDRLVRKYSDYSLKADDGVLGEFRQGELVPALNRKLDEMKEGEVGEPVWQKEGVYIMKLLKRSKPVYLPVENVREKIFSTLFNIKRDEYFNEWIKTLWGRSSIIIQKQ